MNLSALLPPIVVDYLHDRYVAAVADAVAEFSSHKADEDAVTGGLGQEIRRRGAHIFFDDTDKVWIVHISYEKIRGRGPNAPEKKYGSDGLFQIEVVDAVSGEYFQKGLPFQSKMNWKGSNKKLYEQAVLMQNQVGSGIVIDFSATNYMACPASDVVATLGNRKAVNQLGAVKPLGQMLGNDFIECRVGTTGFFFDAEKESYSTSTDRPAPRHLLSTQIRAISRDEASNIANRRPQ